MVTREFQSWYERRGFGSPNEHGFGTGILLMGFDPLDFLGQWTRPQGGRLQEYFAQMKAR